MIGEDQRRTVRNRLTNGCSCSGFDEAVCGLGVDVPVEARTSEGLDGGEIDGLFRVQACRVDFR